MSKRNFVLAVMAAMVFTVILKIGLLFGTHREVKATEATQEKVVLPPELNSLKLKITDSSLTLDERFLAIDAVTRLNYKDLAIVTLEKIEENEKTTPIGDRLRRAVVALRTNQSVDQLKKNEK